MSRHRFCMTNAREGFIKDHLPENQHGNASTRLLPFLVNQPMVVAPNSCSDLTGAL